MNPIDPPAQPPSEPTVAASPPAGPAGWPRGRFQGRLAFADAVRRVLGEAHLAHATEMILCDPDFADWPLGERAVAEGLQAWSQMGRSVRLLAHHFDAVVLGHARLVRWRGQWSHRVEARASRQMRVSDFPSVIIVDDWAMWRMDPDHGVFLAHLEPAECVLLRQRVEEVWAQSAPAFPSTTLGL